MILSFLINIHGRHTQKKIIINIIPITLLFYWLLIFSSGELDSWPVNSIRKSYPSSNTRAQTSGFNTCTLREPALRTRSQPWDVSTCNDELVMLHSDQHCTFFYTILRKHCSFWVMEFLAETGQNVRIWKSLYLTWILHILFSPKKAVSRVLVRTRTRKPDCLGLKPSSPSPWACSFDNLRRHSVLQGPHLENGDNNSIFLTGLLWGINELIHAKCWEQCMGH